VFGFLWWRNCCLPCQICWLCLATKGNDGDLDRAFTNGAPDAGFWNTYLSENPWVVRPAYSWLEGFSVALIVPDLLHVVNMGVARDLCGSILKKLVRENHSFVAPNIPERLALATASLRSFARANALPLRLKKLSKKKLNWSSGKYAEFRSGSGYDVYVVCRWLHDVLTPYSTMFPSYCTLLWSLNSSLNILYNASWFPTQAELSRVKILGTMFIKLYIQHAAAAIASNEFEFRVRPKFHLLHHVFWWKRSVNVAKYSTWMDEDFLRRISKTLELTNSVTAQRRTLERWMLALPETLRRSMAQ
jgi:hypothetical protein